jgi:hypothetical protein
MLVNFNGNSPATTSFDSGFIDVSAYAYFRISHTCSTTNHKYIVYWSTTGLTVHETITGAVKGAGSFGTDILTVQARFARFVLDLGAPSVDAQLQCFFFDELGAGSLKNLGAGAKIYSLSASGVRSVTSSDASLTVTESANEIDVTVAPGLTTTLSSAGGTNTLVVDGTGPSLSVKGLTAGTGITLTPGANDITITNAAGGSNWTVSGAGVSGYVYPTSVAGISVGTSVTIGSGYSNKGAIACSSVTQKGGESILIGCSTCVQSGGDTMYNNAMYNSINSNQTAAAGGAQFRRNVIMACSEAGMFPSAVSVFDSAIIGCYKGYINQGSRGAVIASTTSTINSSGSDNIILAAGTNCSISGASSRCAVLSGATSTITACTDTVVIGPSVTCTGTKSFSANLGSTAWTTSTANKWNVKAPGGAVYYSDDPATIGVSLAAGGNSWVAVSDRNLKENLVPLDGANVLAKIDMLPVYSYNFIGHKPRCFGPVAQDWNSLFPAGKENTLGIDQGDVLGVCLAAIRELSSRTKELSQKIKSLASP